MWRNSYIRKLIKSFFIDWTGELLLELGSDPDSNFILNEFGGQMEFSVYATNLAAKHGRVDVFKILLANNVAFDFTPAVFWAASFGRVETVKWLYNNFNVSSNTNTIDWAVCNGELDTAKWLMERHRSVVVADWAVKLAMDKGHFEVVRWLAEIPKNKIMGM